MLQWQPVDLRSDPDAPEHLGDPGELVAAAGLLLEDIGRPAWMADAACRDHPELTWFPGPGADMRPAKEVCAGCLVRQECLDYAVGQGTLLTGIWGGTTVQQRKRLTRTPSQKDAA